MRPRLLSLLRIPDFVSLLNAGLGFGAVAVLIGVGGGIEPDPSLAARLVLLAAVADGLDGFVARRVESSEIGVELDSLGDVVSFGVAPAFLVHYVVRETNFLLSFVPVVFVLAAIVRLAAYNVDGCDSSGFTGVPSTLAGSTVAIFHLAGVVPDAFVVEFYLALTLVLALLMLTDISYPELKARDALVMGAVIVA
ncbi:MAG: CDP-alcohol phosphatidyltransferase family protein, partial [Halobacteria archaeon]|nr:CDP-alcohol phosphatidyltransferase family protein [Halobacteria archaeon]